MSSFHIWAFFVKNMTLIDYPNGHQRSGSACAFQTGTFLCRSAHSTIIHYPGHRSQTADAIKST